MFATAFDQYAVKAFEVNAVDYLLKPFDKKRVSQAIQKARASRMRRTALRGKIRDAGADAGIAEAAGFQDSVESRWAGMFLVNQKDICYASIEDGVISVVTAGVAGMEGQSNCRTLEELLDSLDPKLFWRAHRSYLVNINRIKRSRPMVQEFVPVADGRQEANRDPRQPGSDQTSA